MKRVVRVYTQPRSERVRKNLAVRVRYRLHAATGSLLCGCLPDSDLTVKRNPAVLVVDAAVHDWHPFSSPEPSPPPKNAPPPKGKTHVVHDLAPLLLRDVAPALLIHLRERRH